MVAICCFQPLARLSVTTLLLYSHQAELLILQTMLSHNANKPSNANDGGGTTTTKDEKTPQNPSHSNSDPRNNPNEQSVAGTTTTTHADVKENIADRAEIMVAHKKSRRFTDGTPLLLSRSQRATTTNSLGKTSSPTTTANNMERPTRDSDNINENGGERDTSIFESDMSLQAQTLYRPGDFKSYTVRKLLSDMYDLVRGKHFLRISGIKFYVKHVLYRGRFSRVELVEESSTGELWCMKRTWIAREVDLEEAAHEYNVLMSHAHPLIVYAVHAGVVIAPNRKLRTHAEVRMIMPYIEGTCLEEELYKRRHDDDPMPVQRVLRIMRQLLDALLELHRHRVPLLHLDVCPGNIIMTRYEDWPVIVGLDSAGPAHVDLRDKAEVRRLKFLSEEIVDPWYRAPELVDINANSFFDERADIWSAGCLLYALCFYESPFRPKMRQNMFGGAGVMHLQRETWLDVKNRQKRGAFNVPFDIYPAEVVQLMRRMIVPNPRQRVTTEIAIQLVDSLIVQLGSDTQIDVKYPWMHPMVAGVIGDDFESKSSTGVPTISAIMGQGNNVYSQPEQHHQSHRMPAQHPRQLSGQSSTSLPDTTAAGGVSTSSHASTNNVNSRFVLRMNKSNQLTAPMNLKDDFLGRSLAQTLAFNEVVLNHLCNPPSAPHEKLKLGVVSNTPTGSMVSYNSGEKRSSALIATASAVQGILSASVRRRATSQPNQAALAAAASSQKMPPASTSKATGTSPTPVRPSHGTEQQTTRSSAASKSKKQPSGQRKSAPQESEKASKSASAGKRSRKVSIGGGIVQAAAAAPRHDSDHNAKSGGVNKGNTSEPENAYDDASGNIRRRTRSDSTIASVKRLRSTTSKTLNFSESIRSLTHNGAAGVDDDAKIANLAASLNKVSRAAMPALQKSLFALRPAGELPANSSPTLSRKYSRSPGAAQQHPGDKKKSLEDSDSDDDDCANTEYKECTFNPTRSPRGKFSTAALVSTRAKATAAAAATAAAHGTSAAATNANQQTRSSKEQKGNSAKAAASHPARPPSESPPSTVISTITVAATTSAPEHLPAVKGAAQKAPSPLPSGQSRPQPQLPPPVKLLQPAKGKTLGAKRTP